MTAPRKSPARREADRHAELYPFDTLPHHLGDDEDEDRPTAAAVTILIVLAVALCGAGWLTLRWFGWIS